MKFAHVTIMVKNMEESLKFYQNVVGLSLNKRFPAGPEMEIAFLGEGETKVELVCNDKLKDINLCQDISLGFQVDSLNDMMKYIYEMDLEIHSGPFEPNPTTKFFYILDPNGVKIQFIEY